MTHAHGADAAASWPDEVWPESAALSAERARFLCGATWPRGPLVQILGERAQHDLSDPRTALVVTGQQPAVGGGPLYTLIKTAHAIALADTLGTPDYPLVPLFWCASEDHDLGEAGHADLITRDGSIRRFSADLGPGRAGLRHRPAHLWWPALVAHCRTWLGAGLGERWLAGQAPVGEEGMGAWQCRLLRALFRSHGLLCIEAHRLRPLWQEVLDRAIREWPAGALEQRRGELLSHGRGDPFGQLQDPPLFADRPDGRVPVQRSAAADLLASDPDILSPGAALRPVLQQAALPAAYYVAGPSEMAYHAFISPLYAALGAIRPRLVPRCGLTLVPGWVERGLQAWSARPHTCSGEAPVLPPDPDQPSLVGLEHALAQLEQEAARCPPAQQRRLASGLIRVRANVQRLSKSLERGRRHADHRPAWGALCSYLRPRGQAQERTMSLIQALWQHGPGLADQMVAAARGCRPGEHRFLSIDAPAGAQTPASAQLREGPVS